MACACYRPSSYYTRLDNNITVEELLSMNCNSAVSNNSNGFYRKLAVAADFSKTEAEV